MWRQEHSFKWTDLAVMVVVAFVAITGQGGVEGHEVDHHHLQPVVTDHSNCFPSEGQPMNSRNGETCEFMKVMKIPNKPEPVEGICKNARCAPKTSGKARSSHTRSLKSILQATRDNQRNWEKIPH